MTTTCPFCGADLFAEINDKPVYECGNDEYLGFRATECRDAEVARLTRERDEAREDAARMRVDWDAHRREIDQTNDIAAQVMRERDEARAEVARLKSGGCTRDQRTTQFCAEAVALQERVRRLEEAGDDIAKIIGPPDSEMWADAPECDRAYLAWTATKETKP